MMFIQKNNTHKLRYSKVRSNSITLLPKKNGSIAKPPRVKTLSPTTKPSCISKRSVSLPSNLRKTTIKTKKLFWFIPTEHQRKKGQSPCRDEGVPKRIQASSSDAEENHFQNAVKCEKPILTHEIPESVALEWITSSSTHSLSDSSVDGDDDDNDDLFGLEFVDSVTEFSDEN